MARLRRPTRSYRQRLSFAAARVDAAATVIARCRNPGMTREPLRQQLPTPLRLGRTQLARLPRLLTYSILHNTPSELLWRDAGRGGPVAELRFGVGRDVNAKSHAHSLH